MKFNDLQERLRLLLCARLSSGELSGSSIARRIGLKQAHVSNFLHRKRGMSLEALDGVLGVLRISVLDLVEPDEINQRLTVLDPPVHGEFDTVPLVTPEAAANLAFIAADQVVRRFKYRKSFLRLQRRDLASPRKKWRRFVLIEIDESSGSAMLPRLQPRSVVLIDRHYNSLKPYRNGERNMYAVRWANTTVVRFLELRDGHLFLIPMNPGSPTVTIEIPAGKAAEDYVVGRVVQAVTDT